MASQKDDGFNFSAYMIDVAEYASCKSGIKKILDDAGYIDVLVNNAGITRDATLKTMTLEKWRIVADTNLDELFNMAKQVLDTRLAQEWGRIINISSVSGQQGAFGQTNHAATKAGIHGFTKALALEVARKGIAVNTVSPGYLRTRMSMNVPREIMEKKFFPISRWVV